MNLPNRLTIGRLVLAALFVVAMESGWPFSRTAAWILFVMASATDYIDGEIARRWKLITDFGKLMDPVADKILTAAAFICLAGAGAIPPWAVIVIVSREFLITALRSLAAAKGRILPAERLGKYKTALQMATILFFLTFLAVGEWVEMDRAAGTWAAGLWTWLGNILVWATVFLTVFSGAGYLWKNRALLADA